MAVLTSDRQQKPGKREGQDKPRMVLSSPVGRNHSLELVLNLLPNYIISCLHILEHSLQSFLIILSP